MNINIGSKRKHFVEEVNEEPKTKKACLEEKRNFNHLPNEIIQKIFSHLEPADLLSMEATSKRFFDLRKNYCKYSPQFRSLAKRLIAIRDELLNEYHTHLGEQVMFPRPIFLNNECTINKFLTPNAYIFLQKRKLEVLTMGIEKPSQYKFEGITLLPEITKNELSEKAIESTLQTLHIIKQFQQSLMNNKKIGRIMTFPTKEELIASQKDLLVLAKKTQMTLGILFNYDRIHTNLTFKPVTDSRKNLIFSFNRACQLKLPLNLITHLFISGIEKQPNQIMNNLLNTIIRHPDRTKLVEYIEKNFPDVSLKPCNNESNNTINTLIEYCNNLADLKVFLPYVFENGALPLEKSNGRISPTYKKLYEIDQPMLTLEFLHHMKQNVSDEVYRDFKSKYENHLKESLSNLIGSDSDSDTE